MSSIVTMITDYGVGDYYVGAMKGVLLSVQPDVLIVDVTHEIARHNVTHGAFVLWQTLKWFPPNTVHLAVVDPGVGTDRRAIVARCNGQTIVTPDNGLLTLAYKELPFESVHFIEQSTYLGARLSSTFHGRDLFAPAAAHLSAGVPPAEMGPPAERVELLPLSPRAEVLDMKVRGSVLYVDHFGTLVTNIQVGQLAEAGLLTDRVSVSIDGQFVGSIRSTFGDVSLGEAVALMGSCDLLEIAVNQGSAVERFGGGGSVTVC